MSTTPTPAGSTGGQNLTLALADMPDADPTAGKPATPYAYTPQDLNDVRAITTWLREHDQSRSWLGKKTRISSSTISQVLNQKYPSSPASYLQQMLAVLHVESERLADGTPGYVEGSVHRLAFVVCDRTRKNRSMGALVGHVGVGKTRSLRELQTRRPQTLMVEANPQMTPGTLLVDLLEQLGLAVPPGLDRKFQALVGALQGTNYLLLVDEAETINGVALHYLRRLHDKAGVGVVLAGTTRLIEMIKPEHGQFEQIRSRISMWPATIKGITRDDADEMARMALSEAGATDVPDEVLDALWDYSAGSARVLMRDLVPALRDYGLGKLPLTARLVDSIASKVLYLQRSGTPGGAAA